MRALLLTICCLNACAPAMRPFPMAEPMWEDTDRRTIENSPDEYWSGLIFDGADQMYFRPVHRGLGVVTSGPAANVNAWDEVPNSSWFENRIGVHDVSPEELMMGPCTEDNLLDDESIGWLVTGAKPNGLNPGFQMETEDGRKYLMKFDGIDQGPRATASDVIGSKLYWAAGFHSPCNQVVSFTRDRLSIDPEATWDDVWGNEHPLTEADIDRVLDKALPLGDGVYRGSASAYVQGIPIGPWTYQGTLEDDPNDVIPHEDRRDLRGSKLLSAWLNHFDSREQNTLATWVPHEGGGGHVRHYMIDFGDTLGSRWEVNDEMLSRRFGHSYYFDFTHILQDTFSLGTVSRPWDQVSTEDHPVWGTFDVEPFDPRTYKGGYPNLSFLRMDDGDGAWMARILARFDDELLTAAIDTAQLPNPDDATELHRILRGRLDAVLDVYLTARSPLAEPVFQGDILCVEDLGRTAGVYDLASYSGQLYNGTNATPVTERAGPYGEHGVCVDLSSHTSDYGFTAINAQERYRVLDLISHPSDGRDALPPLRLHLYDTDEGWFLAGIERPENDRPPTR